MTNGFFNHDNPESRRTVARAESVNNTFQAIAAAFDALPTEARLKLGTITVGVDNGAANAYRVTLPYPPTSYADGMEIVFRAASAATAASTINVYGVAGLLGVKAIKRADGADTGAGDIPAGAVVVLRYDATGGAFRLVSPGEMVTRAQMMAAIAQAVLPVGAGQVKITFSDAVGRYLFDAIEVSGLSKEVVNAGGDETLRLTVSPISAATETALGTVTLRAIRRAALRHTLATR